MPLINVTVAPLAAGDPDLDAVHRIERVSLSPGAHSCVADQLEQAFTRAWVARDAASKTPLGFIVTWLVADELHVLDVATDPQFRRQGVGRALMNEAMEFARTHHVRLLLLEVRRHNRAAVQLYRTLGFTVSRLRSAYYDDGEDALEMTLVLDPETGDIVPGVDEVQLEEA
jgi:ribosomal-protein-alanine N-acetyltransferase